MSHRREPALNVTFRDAAGKSIGNQSTRGAPIDRASLDRKKVPGNERRSVVLCDREHVLAVVQRDGILVQAAGPTTAAYVHDGGTWLPLVHADGAWRTLAAASSASVELVCIECARRLFLLRAADVPDESAAPTGRVVAAAVHHRL